MVQGRSDSYIVSIDGLVWWCMAECPLCYFEKERFVLGDLCPIRIDQI